MLDLSDIDKLIFVSSECLNEILLAGPGVRVRYFFIEIELVFIIKSIGEWSDERIFEFSIWDWIWLGMLVMKKSSKSGSLFGSGGQ